MVAVGFLLLLLAPALAHAQGGGADTAQIVWTAPGDDIVIGTAAAYEMRFSTAPITSGNWGGANVVAGMPVPLASGRRQGVAIPGLSTDTTYYFAMRTVDDAGNWSSISNVLRWDWTADTAAPPVPLSVSGVRLGADVGLNWSAVVAADLDGYSVYRATSEGGPFVRVNPTLVTPNLYLDTTVPPGLDVLWYRVTASDLSGNESGQSASTQVRMVTPSAAWTLSPVFPNPSTTSESVCIPIAIPSSGPGNATLDIVNAGGQRIRRIRIETAATCGSGSGVVWDGANESGFGVAPGVYSARLMAGSTRKIVKFVRVP